MSSSSSKSETAAIQWISHTDDGPSFGFDNAKIKCPECDGWSGLTCPHGCGVRLVSTQAEDDERHREQMRVEGAERRARRDARRAQRKAGVDRSAGVDSGLNESARAELRTPPGRPRGKDPR